MIWVLSFLLLALQLATLVLTLRALARARNVAAMLGVDDSPPPQPTTLSERQATMTDMNDLRDALRRRSETRWSETR